MLPIPIKISYFSKNQKYKIIYRFLSTKFKIENYSTKIMLIPKVGAKISF